MHLPLMDFGDCRWTVEDLVAYVEDATSLGFDAVCANDHMVFSTPWLDGPTALAAVLACSGDARLVTTVANPVVRGPVALAKALAGLDVMSRGRVVAGLGPGSAVSDYASVGVPFEERWARFDDAVRAVRALLRGEAYDGAWYACRDALEPLPVQPGGPPLWVASWGSDRGLRRATRLGDGWLASAYNTTPTAFGRAWRTVLQQLEADARPGDGFANALATMWFHIDPHAARDVLEERLAPMVHRPTEEIRDRLAFGPAQAVRDKVWAYGEVGLQWMLVWPVADEIEQLHRFSEEVIRPFQRETSAG